MAATRPGGSSLPSSSTTRGPWLGWPMSAPSTSAAAARAASAASVSAAEGVSPPGQGQRPACSSTASSSTAPPW
jgi:hypothetical protein